MAHQASGREDNDKGYRHLMDAIVASLSSSKQGEEWMKEFGSVCMTIACAMEYAGQLLPDQEAVIRMYEERLKEVRQIKKSWQAGKDILSKGQLAEIDLLTNKSQDDLPLTSSRLAFAFRRKLAALQPGRLPKSNGQSPCLMAKQRTIR